MLDRSRALGRETGLARGRGRGGVSPVPLQVEEEPGRSHLPEEHKEGAGSAGGEACPLGALGLARGKPPDHPLSLATHPHPSPP